MNLRQIEAFRAVIDTGTVSRAAERLSISQPAVTKLLQHLERTIGFALFDRARGRLSPTAEGMMLYDEVERVFRGLDDLARFTDEIRTLQHGALRIGAMPALSIGFIQDLVARFVETRPAVRVSIQTRTSPKLVEWLVSGHLDVGFTSHPPDHPEVTSEPLCSAELVCILPRKHRLTSKRVVHAADFAGEQFISFGPDSPYRPQLDDIGRGGDPPALSWRIREPRCGAALLARDRRGPHDGLAAPPAATLDHAGFHSRGAAHVRGSVGPRTITLGYEGAKILNLTGLLAAHYR